MKTEPWVAVIGGGPAGLMAAETLSAAGVDVKLYDAMPSVGRKFLLAGKGGLNLTHSEPISSLCERYGDRSGSMRALVQRWTPEQLRQWAQGLGISTFVGTSGRVFPSEMKAAPLLRAWLHRLRHPEHGHAVQFHMRHRWTGWTPAGHLSFVGPSGHTEVQPAATVLALGGASWPQLGSDGQWVPMLQARGVAVEALRPSNCGFDVLNGWTVHFRDRFAGHPFKLVSLCVEQDGHLVFQRRGEFVATATGIEGSLVYAASALLRDQIDQMGSTTVYLDLLPDVSPQKVLAAATHPRGSRSLSSHLKSRLGLEGIKMGLLHEVLHGTALQNNAVLAATIKRLPLQLSAARPLQEAISTAGGVRFEMLTPDLMLQPLPGVFCAGEMLNWEAPTGGYLLQGCMSSGRAAAQGVLGFLGQTRIQAGTTL